MFERSCNGLYKVPFTFVAAKSRILLKILLFLACYPPPRTVSIVLVQMQAREKHIKFGYVAIDHTVRVIVGHSEQIDSNAIKCAAKFLHT